MLSVTKYPQGTVRMFTRPLHLWSSKRSKAAFGWWWRQTHMKPVCAILDHPLAFSGELAEVRSEDGRGDDCSRHSLSELLGEERNENLGLLYKSVIDSLLHVTRGLPSIRRIAVRIQGGRILCPYLVRPVSGENLWSVSAAKTQVDATRSFFSTSPSTVQSVICNPDYTITSRCPEQYHSDVQSHRILLGTPDEVE